MYKIPIYRPYLCGNEKDYVNQCLDSTWISSKGEFIDKFEVEFSNYIGVEYATSVCNGTVAIHLAIEALGLKVGDEILYKLELTDCLTLKKDQIFIPKKEMLDTWLTTTANQIVIADFAVALNQDLHRYK